MSLITLAKQGTFKVPLPGLAEFIFYPYPCTLEFLRKSKGKNLVLFAFYRESLGYISLHSLPLFSVSCLHTHLPVSPKTIALTVHSNVTLIVDGICNNWLRHVYWRCK